MKMITRTNCSNYAKDRSTLHNSWSNMSSMGTFPRTKSTSKSGLIVSRTRVGYPTSHHSRWII
jgi:hypothetical protein